jgi:magnesium chelatase family protein
MDRIDIWLPVEHIDYEHLTHNTETGESSYDIQSRIITARKIQYLRFAQNRLNSSLSSREIQKEQLSPDVLITLNKSAEVMKLSPRAYHRVIKLARTIADLDNNPIIQVPHILEALQYRPQIN